MPSEQAINQPWVLYALGAVLVVTAVAAAVPKVLGPIGQAWAAWLESRRRAPWPETTRTSPTYADSVTICVEWLTSDWKRSRVVTR